MCPTAPSTCIPPCRGLPRCSTLVAVSAGLPELGRINHRLVVHGREAGYYPVQHSRLRGFEVPKEWITDVEERVRLDKVREKGRRRSSVDKIQGVFGMGEEEGRGGTRVEPVA